MKKLLFAAAAVIAINVAQAQTTMQFPQTPWGGFAPARVQCGQLKAANFNVTTDQPIYIAVPTAPYQFDSIEIGNPSVSLDTAAGGFYSAASKGGVAVVANTQVYSALTTNAANTTGNTVLATIATAGNTTSFTSKVLYLSLTTPQGAAATADVRIYCRPLY